jgi:PDZ domain
MFQRISLILCWSLVGSSAAYAADNSTADAIRRPAASVETEQRLRQDVQLMLSQLVTSGALGEHPEQISLHLDEPAHRVMNLGVLVDSAGPERARDGLRVLGATPGSIAEHLGLRPGDVIVAVNGISLRGLGADADGHALAAMTLKSTVEALADSAPLQLDVLRAGDAVALNAPVHSVYLPALRMELGAAALATTGAADSGTTSADAGGGCGRVSTWDVAPRSDRQYHARIVLIDGVTPGPSGGETYRVSAGTHRLLVAEDIPTRQIGAGEIASLRRDTNKELTVTVKPGTTSMVAAQLHLDKIGEVMRGGFWDPVVWREIALSCP